MIRWLVTLMLIVQAVSTYAQSPDEETLTARILALDKSVLVAQKFNEEIGKIAIDYKLAFIDDETKPSIRYVYKTEKGETLRVDFRYTLETIDSGKRASKKAMVIYQKISGPLSVITDIYNFIFNAHLTGQSVMSATTTGSSISHMGKTYQFIFQEDDYNPGYWVMTFVR